MAMTKNFLCSSCFNFWGSLGPLSARQHRGDATQSSLGARLPASSPLIIICQPTSLNLTTHPQYNTLSLSRPTIHHLGECTCTTIPGNHTTRLHPH